MGWLKRMNARGHDVSIRPAGEHSLVLVDGLTGPSVRAYGPRGLDAGRDHRDESRPLPGVGEAGRGPRLGPRAGGRRAGVGAALRRRSAAASGAIRSAGWPASRTRSRSIPARAVSPTCWRTTARARPPRPRRRMLSALNSAWRRSRRSRSGSGSRNASGRGRVMIST